MILAVQHRISFKWHEISVSGVCSSSFKDLQGSPLPVYFIGLNFQATHLELQFTFCWQSHLPGHPCRLEPRCLYSGSVKCSHGHLLLCIPQMINYFNFNIKKENTGRLLDGLFDMSFKVHEKLCQHNLSLPGSNDILVKVVRRD